MTSEQVDRLVAAFERLAAAQEAWNAQQKAQWEADRARMEELAEESRQQSRAFQNRIGLVGPPIIGG